MADDGNKVTAEVRETFGKGAARKLRANGRVPAVLYGHGIDPQHLALPTHQVGLIIRKANAVLNLSIAGKKQLALVRDVQKDPVKQAIEHLDLIVVRQGERVQVDVPVHVEGEAVAGSSVGLEATTILLEAEATHIPEFLVTTIEGAEEGTQIFARDLGLPPGTSLVTDGDVLVVNITVAAEIDLGEPEVSEEVAEDAGGEGETPEGETADGKTADSADGGDSDADKSDTE